MPYKRKPKYKSLRAKAFKSILIVALILIVLGSVTGLLLHGYSSLSAYKTEADHLIDYMMSLEDGEYIEKLFARTKEIYENRPEDLRSLDVIVTDEYEALFADLVDEDYLKAKEIMTKCLQETGQMNLWLLFSDPANDVYVYVLDADPSDQAYPPGVLA